MPRPKPEAAARQDIDRALEAAGWVIQDADEVNLWAVPGVAVREFQMESGHGFADYLLFVDQRAVGALEAKMVGHTLTGVEGQARKYSDGRPSHVQAPLRPLPFLLLSTGVQTTLTNRFDPHPRSEFCVPLPPLVEQDRIVSTVEGLLSVGEHTERVLSRNSKRVSRLRQSILKWAFEGKLVDQDPNDEPASALLERIRAEREAAVSTKKRLDQKINTKSPRAQLRTSLRRLVDARRRPRRERRANEANQ